MKKINKFILAIASCPMLVTPIIGCTKKQEEPEKTILTITGEKIIDVYEAEIKYAAKDQKGNIVKCKWTIDKTEVATIDLITGVLTPVSAGTATITAVSTEDETVKVSFNIQVVDSFGQWTTTWNTYYQNFIDLGEKYENGTVDPNHCLHHGSNVLGVKLSYNMSDKDQKLSYSYQVGPSHWVRSIDGGGISFEKIKSTLLDLIKGGAQITLINDANTKTIGYSYTSETISEKKVFDENLYLIECVYNDDVDLKITGFTE